MAELGPTILQSNLCIIAYGMFVEGMVRLLEGFVHAAEHACRETALLGQGS
jgi:hypothetical protein